MPPVQPRRLRPRHPLGPVLGGERGEVGQEGAHAGRIHDRWVQAPRRAQGQRETQVILHADPRTNVLLRQTEPDGVAREEPTGARRIRSVRVDHPRPRRHHPGRQDLRREGRVRSAGR